MESARLRPARFARRVTPLWSWAVPRRRPVKSPGRLDSDHFVVDFARLTEVRRLAAEIDRTYPRIEVLANHAGGVFDRQQRTVDGFETTLQVNHLAPFLLTNLLLPKLLESRTSVIQTASNAARLVGAIDLHDLDNDTSFSGIRAYGDAKLANILFTTELHARFHDQGLSSAAFHPGTIASNFASNTAGTTGILYNTRLLRRLLTSVTKGAEQLVWLARSTPGTDWQS